MREDHTTVPCLLHPNKPRRRDGYVLLQRGAGYRYAHVFAWEQISGKPVPPGYIVCHTCDVRNCVQTEGWGVYVVRGVPYGRFGHLWLGTLATNAQDRQDKGRSGISVEEMRRIGASGLGVPKSAEHRVKTGEANKRYAERRKAAGLPYRVNHRGRYSAPRQP